MGQCSNCGTHDKIIKSSIKKKYVNGYLDYNNQQLIAKLKKHSSNDVKQVEDFQDIEKDKGINILFPKTDDQHNPISLPNEVNTGSVDLFDLDFAEDNNIGPYFERANSKNSSKAELFLGSLNNYLSNTTSLLKQKNHDYIRNSFLYSISPNILSLKKFAYAFWSIIEQTLLIGFPSHFRLSFLLIMIERHVPEDYKLVSMSKHIKIKNKTSQKQVKRNYLMKKQKSLLLNKEDIIDIVNQEVSRSHQISKQDLLLINSNSTAHQLNNFLKPNTARGNGRNEHNHIETDCREINESCEESEKERMKKLKDIITKDIVRTFPTNPIFQNYIMKSALERLLYLIADIDEELGYLQGMNYIGAYCLMLTGCNIFFALNLFFLLFNLRSNKLKLNLRSCLLGNFNDLNIVIEEFNKLFVEKYPEIFHKFHQLGIIHLLWVSKWIMTLFTYNFSQSMTICFWELICFFGFDSILLICLFFIEEFKQELNSDSVCSIEDVIRVLEKANDYEITCHSYREHLIKYIISNSSGNK